MKNTLKLLLLYNYLIVLLLPFLITFFFFIFSTWELVLDLDIYLIFNFWFSWKLNILQYFDLKLINKLSLEFIMLINLIIKWLVVIIYSYLLNWKFKYITYFISILFSIIIFIIGYTFFKMLLSV